MLSLAEIEKQPVAGPGPIPALTGPDTPELSGARSLRRSRHGPLPAGTIHSLSYGFQSRPAFRRIWPASVWRITASGILMQYVG